jgi:hypothetical protein
MGEAKMWSGVEFAFLYPGENVGWGEDEGHNERPPNFPPNQGRISFPLDVISESPVSAPNLMLKSPKRIALSRLISRT